MRSSYAAPSPKLKKIWRQWIALHSEMEKEGLPVAAPFFSAMSSKRDIRKRILVVGKATAGRLWIESYRKALGLSEEAAIRERLVRNREFTSCQGNSGAFWRLLAALVNEEKDPDLDGVIWSNVAKIGSRNGNPTGRLLSMQLDLAQRTLQQEIKEYRPSIVTFVTGTFAGELINMTLGLKNVDWNKSSKRNADDDVWWLRGEPAFLWSRHPQGAGREKVDFWIRKARELIGE